MTKENMNIKNEIISLIQKVCPFDEIEKEHIKDTINWISSDTNIFRTRKPATPIKHLVCYTVLCDNKKQKVLLLEHKQAELFLPSGGHVEKNEMPYETVIRELREELGIEAKFVLKEWKIPFFVTQVETVGKTAGHTDVDLWYLLEENSENQINKDSQDFEKEFGEFGWYTFKEILDMPLNVLDPNMHRIVKKIKKYLK